MVISQPLRQYLFVIHILYCLFQGCRCHELSQEIITLPRAEQTREIFQKIGGQAPCFVPPPQIMPVVPLLRPVVFT